MTDDSDGEKNNPDEYRLTVRLDLDTHERWDSFTTDNPTINTKSELVRRSVSEYIRREEEREDGDLTKEQKEIVNVIRNENGRVLNIAEQIVEVAEDIKGSQLSPSEQRELSFDAVSEANNQQTQTLITQLNDFTEESEE